MAEFQGRSIQLCCAAVKQFARRTDSERQGRDWHSSRTASRHVVPAREQRNGSARRAKHLGDAQNRSRYKERLHGIAESERSSVSVLAAARIAPHLDRAVDEIHDPIVLDSDVGIDLRLLAPIVVEAGVCDFDQEQYFI